MFAIDIETCPHCGGTSRVIACIEDPLLIAKIPVVGGTPESHLWSETNPRYLSECLKKWLIIALQCAVLTEITDIANLEAVGAFENN